MATANLGLGITAAGVTASLGISQSGEGEIKQQPTAPMGYAGPISTDTDRVITTTSVNPLIVALDYVTIFWAAGMARDKVQSVTGADLNVIKLSSGGAEAEGDALPDDVTACIIAKEAVVDVTVDGDVILAIATATGARSSLSFRSGADVLIVTQEYLVLSPYYWIEGGDVANELTGDPVTSIRVATADITQDQIISIGILYDSVV